MALEEGAGGEQAQPGRHHPAGPNPSGPGSRRAHRWLPTVVPRIGPRSGQCAVRPIDLRLPGAGQTIGSFLRTTASLTSTLADRDQLIGQVITNLNILLGSLGDQGDQFGKAVTSLSELVHALAGRKEDISNSVAYTNAAAGADRRSAHPGAAATEKVVAQTDRTAGSSSPTRTMSTTCWRPCRMPTKSSTGRDSTVTSSASTSATPC